MLRKFNNFILFFLLVGCLTHLTAQNEISQPYSGFGVGIVNKSSNGILNGMAGTSIAMQNPYYINFRNPASYAAFDSLSFVADAAASIYASTLTTPTSTTAQRNGYARPDYIAIGLPVTKHWRTSVGIYEFSTIGYDMVDSRDIANVGTVSYEYIGRGGLNQLYWGNAFKLCKGLSIGLNASYMFGSVYNTRNISFDGSNFLNSYINDAYHVDGIYLTGGLQYFFKVKENHHIGIGAVYSNTAYAWVRENLLINHYTGTYSPVTTYDTVLCDNTKRGNVTIPQSIGGGLNYTYKEKFNIAADVTWQNWEKYKFMGKSDSLHNSITASLGAQYIPDPFSTKFLKRMTFRAGVKYSTGEIFIRNKPINEFGVCLGVGIPLTTFNTHSSINILFEYGKMGTLINDLVKQDYFRFTLNFTLQEKWYQRMKVE